MRRRRVAVSSYEMEIATVSCDLSIYLWIHQLIFLSIFLLIYHLLTYLSTYLIYLPTHLSTYLSCCMYASTGSITTECIWERARLHQPEHHAGPMVAQCSAPVSAPSTCLRTALCLGGTKSTADWWSECTSQGQVECGNIQYAGASWHLVQCSYHHHHQQSINRWIERWMNESLYQWSMNCDWGVDRL